MTHISSVVVRPVLLVLAFVFVSVAAFPHANGVTGSSTTGCTCHGTSGGTISFAISGPATLANNATGNYTLTITGGSGTKMGVDITVSAGTMGLTTTTNLQLSGNEISHTARLTNRDIQFTVTAPSSGASFTIFYAGVSDFGNCGLGTKAQPLPIQLSSFTVQLVPENSVKLLWSTISEINNYGFRVQRRSDGSAEFADLPGGFVAGHGTTLVARQYSFTDNTAANGSWEYRLAQVDLDGAVHMTDPVAVQVGPGVSASVPGEFSLPQNFPNPFNPSTTIRYGLPHNAFVTLTVYNALGQEVATLVNELQDAGYREVRLDGSSLASGVYIYRLRAGEFVESKKFVLLR